MRNKLNLKEGEVQRILGLHKIAILKESGKSILKEENTWTMKVHTDLEQKDGEGPIIKLWKGTTFKPSTKIPNSLVTTRKVSVQTNLGATANNKSYVIFNCKTNGFYLIGSTNNVMQKYDYKNSKKNIWDGTNMKSLQKLCSQALEVPVRDEVVGNLDNGKEENQNQKDSLVVVGTSGTRYSFDFETIMKAIDDTGKCPRSGTSDQAGTSGTSGVQGTQGTSGVGAPVVIQKPTVTKDDFYQWTMD